MDDKEKEFFDRVKSYLAAVDKIAAEAYETLDYKTALDANITGFRMFGQITAMEAAMARHVNLRDLIDDENIDPGDGGKEPLS